jgi:hypothetical protein
LAQTRTIRAGTAPEINRISTTLGASCETADDTIASGGECAERRRWGVAGTGAPANEVEGSDSSGQVGAV